MMSKNNNKKPDFYVGKVIGNFLVVRLCNERSADGHKLYDVVCVKCGHELKRQRISELSRKNKDDRCNHVDKQTNWHSRRLGGIYRDMLYRCNNPKDKSYRFYGAKGIRVCDDWSSNPQSFNDWAIESGYTKDLTINRIDEEKDYCPENCEWIPLVENSKWKSSTNYISVLGILDSGRGWSCRLGHGINYVNKYLRKHGYKATVKMIIRTICESPELRKEYIHELIREKHLRDMRKHEHNNQNFALEFETTVLKEMEIAFKLEATLYA